MNKAIISGFERVSFPIARKLYNVGITIRVVPCKYRPENHWIVFDLNIADGKKYDPEPTDDELRFAVRISHFEQFNCNSEVGRYASYWIQKL